MEIEYTFDKDTHALDERDTSVLKKNVGKCNKNKKLQSGPFTLGKTDKKKMKNR